MAMNVHADRENLRYWQSAGNQGATKKVAKGGDAHNNKRPRKFGAPMNPNQINPSQRMAKKPAAKPAAKASYTTTTRIRDAAIDMSKISLQNHSAGDTSAAVDIDAKDTQNPQAVTEYINDIMTYFRTIEGRSGPKPDYITKQPHINAKMRAILIDWLVEVHMKFKLMPETLYLTVNLIDRFLERKVVARQRLQLVGVTCMLLASKYEEIYFPEVRDFVYITDRAYTRDQILQMESVVLNTLKFELTVPTPIRFLTRYIKAAKTDNTTTQLAHFFCERTMQEYAMLKFLPSTIAAASVHLALKAMKQPEWTPTLQRYTQYQLAQLLPCAKEIQTVVLATSSLQAVKKKYTSSKFLRVALIPTDGRLR